MKEGDLKKLKQIFKENGSATIHYYSDESTVGYKWIKISVDEEKVDIYPFYAGKVSFIRSRPKITVNKMKNGVDMISIENAGKHKFKYVFTATYNTEEVKTSKKVLSEVSEIE